MMTEAVVNTRQKVKVVFLSKNNSISIKLIEPLDESSPVFQFSLRGGGLHHLCFKCKNLKNKIVDLKGFNGVRLLKQPEPGEAFNNQEIAFVFAGQGLNIELIDTDEKASVIK